MLYPKSNCFLFNMPRITWITGLKHHEPPLLPKGFWINGFWSQRSLKALFQQAAASVRQSVRQVEPVTACHSEIVPSWSYSCYSWPKSRISTSRQSWLKYVEFDLVWPCFDCPVGISWLPDDPGKESKYRRTCNRPDVSEPERLGTRICMVWSEHVKHQISKIIKIAWELGGWLSHSWIDLRNAEHDMGSIVEVLQTVLKWYCKGLRKNCALCPEK